MRLTRKLAPGCAVLILAIAGAVLLVPTASAQEYAVSGVWASTGITGSGTWDAYGTGEITSGTITIEVAASGDIAGACVYTGTYYADEEAWHGRSPTILGNVMIDGNTHPARLWLMGRYENLILVPIDEKSNPYVYGWSLDVSCSAGATHAWTTDDSEIVVDFGWSGSGLGRIAFNHDGTWDIITTPPSTGVPASVGGGIWSGAANVCSTGKTEGVVAGTGTVSLSGSPEVARLIYDVQTAGTVILAQYKENPGGTPPRQALGKYIQVDSNIASPNITWPVELRVYYADAEVAAVGVSESTLKLYRWDETSEAWTVAPDTGVNAAGNYVWAKLTSFSAYSPFGEEDGDLNGDGLIDLLDVRLCLQIATGVITGTAAQQAAADVDEDGDVDLADAQLLAKYVIGSVDKLGGD